MMQVANMSSPNAVILLDTTGIQAGSVASPMVTNDASVVSALASQTTALVAAVAAAAAVQAAMNATPINTNGTTTIAGAALYYGLACVGLGTLWAASVYDIIAGTSTKTLAAGVSLAALGVLGLPGPAGLGVRLNGNLTVVTTGTAAGNLNCLWD